MINRLCVTFFFLLIVVISSYAQEAVHSIIQILPEGSVIMVGSDTLKKGDILLEDATIKWATNNQELYTYTIHDNLPHTFLAKAFQSKGVKTIVEYKVSATKDANNYWAEMKGVADKEHFPEKRIALVIGNANYSNLIPLRNSLSDATAVSEKLQELGFDVMCVYDCHTNETRHLLSRFKDKINKGKYEVALIYFTGHGIQHKGVDYLLPVDIDLSTSDITVDAISVKEVIKFISNTKCQKNIFVFDSCRNETSEESESDDLRKAILPPVGAALQQSTRPGERSIDWTLATNKISPFAEAFINNIGVPGADLRKTFDSIRDYVYKITNKTQRPQPLLNEIIDPFFFYYIPRDNAIISEDYYQYPLYSSRLDIVSSPDSAYVYIDGRFQYKKTPCIIDLPPGEHTVAVGLDNYYDEERVINVSAHRTSSLRVSLKPKQSTGILHIKTNPRGATVFLNGKKQKTPTNVVYNSLRPGKYVIKCVLDGFKPLVDSVNIHGGDEHFVESNLTATDMGDINIITTPVDSKIMVDGTVVTTKKISLKSGKHKVKVSHIGYLTQTFDVNIRAGGAEDKEVILEQSTFSRNSWSNYHVGLTYNWDTNYSVAGTLLGGVGPMSLALTYCSNLNFEEALRTDNGIWIPDYSLSIAPGIQVGESSGLRLVFSVGVGVVAGKAITNPAITFPYRDSQGNPFTITKDASVVYASSVDVNKYVTFSPSIMVVIPLDPIVKGLEFIMGLGYRYTFRQKRGDVFMQWGLGYAFKSRGRNKDS